MAAFFPPEMLKALARIDVNLQRRIDEEDHLLRTGRRLRPIPPETLRSQLPAHYEEKKPLATPAKT